MELAGSQKRHLRSLGHRLDVAISLGKGGLSRGVAAALKELFTRHELLKVRLPALPPEERESLARELSLGDAVRFLGTRSDVAESRPNTGRSSTFVTPSSATNRRAAGGCPG